MPRLHISSPHTTSPILSLSKKRGCFWFLLCVKFAVSMWRCGVTQWWQGFDATPFANINVAISKKMWRRLPFQFLCVDLRLFAKCRLVNLNAKTYEVLLGEVAAHTEPNGTSSLTLP